jgi:hypothetical protein
MAMFRRKHKDGKAEKAPAPDDGATKLERLMRRPGNTAFKQQRLKAWQRTSRLTLCHGG